MQLQISHWSNFPYGSDSYWGYEMQAWGDGWWLTARSGGWTKGWPKMGIFEWCIPERGNWDQHAEIKDLYVFDRPREPTQDMHAPLSHYFISSGHNS